MSKTLFFSTLLLALVSFTVIADAAVAHQDEPVLENFDRYLGRELVKDNRAVNLDINRPLPLSCPPFHLRDKDGEIIDPTKDENNNPVDPMRPYKDRGIPRAVSTRQTCGACHDYDKIVQGYHFQMGNDESFKMTPADQPQPYSHAPGVFGKWNLLYQRELAPAHFDDPSDVDMSPWEWVLSCGICHPGGGPAEEDRMGQRYDKALTGDIGGLQLFGNGDYVDHAWPQTGVLEADCFMCHLEGYEFSLRVQNIKKLNFEYAATAGAGLGYVFGAVKDGKAPKVYYNESLFRADGTVLLHIRRPDDRRCMACHDMSSAPKRGSSWHSHYMQDVHTEQGLGCIDCHVGDIRHNFAKGNSASMTVRNDLDNTMESCESCHEQGLHGAPEYDHDWLPALHLDRLSCEACHITHRPFAPVSTVDTLTGTAQTLAVQTDPQGAQGFAFGAQWAQVSHEMKGNLLDPLAQDLINAAASTTITAKMAAVFNDKEGKSDVPTGLTIAKYIEEAGGLTQEKARTLMLMALTEKGNFSEEEPATATYPVCIFRGKAERLKGTVLKTLDAHLQPKRPGSTISETPYLYGRAKGDGKIYPESYQLGVFWAYLDKADKDDPEAKDVAHPLFLSDMEAAWNFLRDEEYKLRYYPGTTAEGKPAPAIAVPADLDARYLEARQAAEAKIAEATAMFETVEKQTEQAKEAIAKAKAKTEDEALKAKAKELIATAKASQSKAQALRKEAAAQAEEVKNLQAEVEKALRKAIRTKLSVFGAEDKKTLDVFDDNNDSFPEANTGEEITLIGWALKAAVPRLANRDLYYIKGTHAYKVDVTPWANPYEAEIIDMPRIGENAPFLLMARSEQVEVPGEYSWTPLKKEWRVAEYRIGAPIEATVEEVDLSTSPAVAQLAQRLPWTAGHGVEPPEKALGANGCTDCHAPDSYFFFGAALTDPFTEDGSPETMAMHKRLGYDRAELLIGAWREGVLKPLAPWVVLGLLVILLLHYAFIGSKGASAGGPVDVLRFRFYERFSHLLALASVVLLAVTGFCFLLGKNDPLGHAAREIHEVVGFAGAVGAGLVFLVWFLFMFPAKGDLKWLFKAGGYLGGVKGHLPAGKFNAGQKILFWLMMATMGVLALTGINMALHEDAHFARQELVYTVHDIAALLMILMLMAHVYLAAIVVPHSLRAVFGGKVNREWAQAHHSNWKLPKK